MNKNQAIDPLSIPVLSKIFSSSVLTQLAKNGKSKLLTSLAIESELEQLCGDKSLSTSFDFIYSKLKDAYRNEYFYKNIIANKILLGRHSLNTASMHTEFRVGDSKADVLILNGTSHIYEIKTELDSLDRLDGQLSDYVKFSEYVTIVTAEKHIQKLAQRTPNTIGIIALTNEGRLKTIRTAESGKSRLENSLIFDSLQRAEYTNIIKNLTGAIPEVSNGLMYKECKSIFEGLNTLDIHHLVVNTLKRRHMDEKAKEFIHSVPVSLKAAATSIKFTKVQRSNLLSALDKSLSNALYAPT
ncbi:MAG: sce7726 family protein [Colwellia sp.]